MDSVLPRGKILLLSHLQSYSHLKISGKKFREFIRLFSLDFEASKMAQMLGLNRNTVNRYLNALRVKKAEFCKEGHRSGERWRWMRATLGPENASG